jgi:hypothetical protein
MTNRHLTVNTLSRPRVALRLACWIFCLPLGSGCQVLTYRGPNGECFSRTSCGADTAIAALVVDAGTNGIRRVELQGYRNSSSDVLGAITEAAVRGALQAPK